MRRRKSIPVSTRCRNCGEAAVGPYCHACGQSLFAGRGQSLGHLILDLLENAFALDRKTPRTLVCLFTKPGFLSAEYRDGKIDRYVHPVKLFWMSVLACVMVLVAYIECGDQNVVQSDDKGLTIQIGGAKASTPKTDSLTLPAAGVTGNAVENPAAAKSQSPEELEDQITPAKLKGYVSSWAPYVAFALIPVFGLVLWMFFRRNRLYYMYHLVMAVHFHAFLLLYASILMLATIIFNGLNLPEWLAAALSLVPGLYFMVSIYRFYRPARKRTAVWKAVLITAFYGFVLIVVSAILALWYVRIKGYIEL